MSSLVLVHGGVHGAWCWERMLEPLQTRGHDVQAFDLPGRGADAARAGQVTLDDHVDRISEAVDAASGPAILVAHSMGGLWCSQLAERRPDAITRIIYLSAVVAPDGRAAFPDLAEGHESAIQSENAFRPPMTAPSLSVRRLPRPCSTGDAPPPTRLRRRPGSAPSRCSR